MTLTTAIRENLRRLLEKERGVGIQQRRVQQQQVSNNDSFSGIVRGRCRRFSSSSLVVAAAVVTVAAIVATTATTTGIVHGFVFSPSSSTTPPRTTSYEHLRPTTGITASTSKTTMLHQMSSSSQLSSSSAATPTTPTTSTSSTIPSWKELQDQIASTNVGTALNHEVTLRQQGLGSPHVHSKLRLFQDQETQQPTTKPNLTLYRDHAGWCPYCQKTMLLIEAKRIPINIELINMRSYGDKPSSFLRKVPGGLLPALEVHNKGIVTESSVIMQLLDEWHTTEDGYTNQMVPNPETQPQHYRQYQSLLGLERELFRWWCTLVFRPETPSGGLGNNPLLTNLFGGNSGGSSSSSSSFSSSLQGFLGCFQTVNDQLASTKGAYFLDYTTQHPTMIDFVFASHVERMLASVAYWKGINLRDTVEWKQQFSAIQTWIDALERHEYYLAYKSDYYTHIKDIPPQYGPGFDGIAFQDKISEFQANILGRSSSSRSSSTSSSSSSWTLPLSHDDPLQPLYRGPPLPLCVLKAAGITPDDDDTSSTTKDYDVGDGSYMNANPKRMAIACRQMATWKLANNGPNISIFASRGGPKGSNNPRKTFGAELADPYAESDASVVDTVDAVLRVMVLAIQDIERDNNEGDETILRGIPSTTKYRPLLEVAMKTSTGGSSSTSTDSVIASLAYLRDRVGVPRDLPLASARYVRAYLNWTMDQLRDIQG